MHGYPVGVHFDAGLGHQDESAATHICLDLQCGWVITAFVKSSFTVPPTARISIRAGTTHWPRRVAFPPW